MAVKSCVTIAVIDPNLISKSRATSGNADLTIVHDTEDRSIRRRIDFLICLYILEINTIMSIITTYTIAS